MRGGKLALPLGGGEDVPLLSRDPVDAGHVRGRNQSLALEEFGVTGGAGGVGEQRMARAVGGVGRFVQVDEGEHFAADGLVAYPEKEVGAPLHGLDHVRQSEEIGAKAFGVHGFIVHLFRAM